MHYRGVAPNSVGVVSEFLIPNLHALSQSLLADIYGGPAALVADCGQPGVAFGSGEQPLLLAFYQDEAVSVVHTFSIDGVNSGRPERLTECFMINIERVNQFWRSYGNFSGRLGIKIAWQLLATALRQHYRHYHPSALLEDTKKSIDWLQGHMSLDAWEAATQLVTLVGAKDLETATTDEQDTFLVSTVAAGAVMMTLNQQTGEFNWQLVRAILTTSSLDESMISLPG